MPRRISNKRLFQSLDGLMIAQEEREMRTIKAAKESDPHRPHMCQERSRHEVMSEKSEERESVIVNSAIEMENLPTFELLHQIFRTSFMRKYDKLYDSHGKRGRGRSQWWLRNRHQTIRCIID